MEYNPDIHHLRSIRLQGYDYSMSGLYFVTICTQEKVCLFGNIMDGEMRLNDAGIMVKTVWNEIPIFYKSIFIDGFILMPNHVHGIINIDMPTDSDDALFEIGIDVGAGPRACPVGTHTGNGNNKRCHDANRGNHGGIAPTVLSLPDVVHRFKTMTTNRYTVGVKQNGWPPFPGKLWQRNYWERIIRDETELNHIREYIQYNPKKWMTDKIVR